MQVRAIQGSQYVLVFSFIDTKELHGGRLCTTLVANSWDEMIEDAKKRFPDINDYEKVDYRLYTRQILTYENVVYIAQNEYKDVTSSHKDLLKELRSAV